MTNRFSLAAVSRAHGGPEGGPLLAVIVDADRPTADFALKLLRAPGVFASYGFADEPFTDSSITLRGPVVRIVLTAYQALTLHHEAYRLRCKSPQGTLIWQELRSVYEGER